MRKVVYLIFCSILVVSFPVLSLAANKTIKVGIYQNKPKVFINSAGEPRGFFIDILNYIASKEGWQLDYVLSTWEKNLEKLEKAEIDLVLDIAESERRAEIFDFNKESVFSNWAIIYVQKNSQIQSILDLKGKKIAAMKGDISYEDFSRNIDNLGIYARFVEVDEFSDIFELIAQEKVDAGIISRLYGLQHENEYNADRSTVICCPQNLYFAVPRNKNQDLIKKIDQHLYQLKRDDQSIYYASLIKWIEGFSPWKFPAWLVWLLVMAAGILILFATGLAILKMQVKARTDELNESNEKLKAEISDHKQVQKEKEMLQEQLIQAQKMEAIGTLAGGIAHDFNNSLHAITSYAQLMKIEKDRDAQDSDYLNRILDITKKSNDFTQQLLTFSRKIKSKFRPTNLNTEIFQVQTLLEITISKMIKIELDLAKDLKIINADSVQIEQILLNLALNASHAMSDEGLLTIKTKNTVLDEDFIKTRLEADPGEYVLLSIADTGHGMEKEIQNRIFEPFFTTKNPGRGTGLGLSMVYGIVKNHHGYIECSSKPAEGSRFDMYFPVLKLGKIPENEVSNNEEKIPTGDETILMVDDQESILDVGEKMLQQFGYSVTTACSAEKAIEIYRVEKDGIDLVILDINMPGIGGHKCLERLLEINPAVKTIVTSGSLSAEAEESIHKMGADAFIEKPYQFKVLLVKIREIFDNQDE